MPAEIPTCPGCENPLPGDPTMCGVCGLSLTLLDEHFGDDCVVLDRVTDAAHVLKRHEKEVLVDAIRRFERGFPQLFFTVYIGGLPPAHGSLRLFGFWLLNRAAVTAVDFTRPNENGVLVIVDVRARAISLTLGYYLESSFRQKELAAVLERARPSLASRDFGKALVRLLGDFSRLLAKKAGAAGSHPDTSRHIDGIDQLPRLRRGHRRRDDIQR